MMSSSGWAVVWGLTVALFFLDVWWGRRCDRKWRRLDAWASRPEIGGVPGPAGGIWAAQCEGCGEFQPLERLYRTSRDPMRFECGGCCPIEDRFVYSDAKGGSA